MQFERFLLNDVLIDTQKMSVKVEGSWLPLEHKQLSLIKLLIENAPEPVSRDEIINQLWPNLIVSDNSVSQLVAQIRKTLSDTSKEPKFIKTVPRVGYQCIAVVADAPTFLERGKTPQQNVPFNWLFCGVLVGFLIACIVFFDVNLFKHEHKIKYVSRLTSSPGAEVYLNFSPNGRYLAYSQIVTGESQYDLVVHDLQTNTSHTIKSSRYSEQAPSWSEDGNWLVYYRYSPFSCEIRAVSVHNAIELWRLNRDMALLECNSAHNPQTIIWDHLNTLFVNEVDSGKKVLVKYNINKLKDNGLELSERKVVIEASEYDLSEGEIIYLSEGVWYKAKINNQGDLESSEEIDVQGKPYFGFSNNSFFSIGSDLELHFLGQNSATLYQPYGEISEISIDRNKGLIAHTEGKAEVNLYEYSTLSKQFTAISSNARIDTHASISLDGMQTAYVSEAAHAALQIEEVEIWLKHRYKSSPSLLTKLPKNDKPKLLLFSPNGEYLAVLSESNTLFIINTFSKIPRSVIKENSTLENIYWSNDGKSLHFKTVEDGRLQFWRHDIANSSNYLLPDSSQEYIPLMNKNDSFRAYLSDVEGYLFNALGGEVPLQQLSHSLQLYKPAIYDGGIYYVVRQGHQLSLYNYQIKGQNNHFVSDIGLHLYNVNAVLSLSTNYDGSYIIMNRVENLEKDIVLHEFTLD